MTAVSFKALGMTKWAPTQDGTRGPVINRIVFLESRKSQNKRNMGRIDEEKLYGLTVVS
jgi:hypothetical protein